MFKNQEEKDSAIKAEVQNILNTVSQPTRKQYPVARHQEKSLNELGLTAYMPEQFGYTDAAKVIEAAKQTRTAVMNAYGEGEELDASTLNQLLNAEIEPPVAPATTGIGGGDMPQVEEIEQYSVARHAEIEAGAYCVFVLSRDGWDAERCTATIERFEREIAGLKNPGRLGKLRKINQPGQERERDDKIAALSTELNMWKTLLVVAEKIGYVYVDDNIVRRFGVKI